MRPTMILYAHPQSLRILADDMVRFSGTRTAIHERLYAAWLVFIGEADALCWTEWNKRRKCNCWHDCDDPTACRIGLE